MEKITNKLYKRQLLSIVIFILIQLLTLISPYIMGITIDDFIPTHNTKLIVVGIVLFVTIPLLSVLLQTGYNYSTIKYVRKKGNEVALKIMENLVYKEKSYFDKENSLELLSYTSKEAVGYINFYVIELSKYYVNIIVSIVVLVILFCINPILGGLQLLYLPFAYFPVRRIMRNVDKEIEIVVQKNAEISQVKGDVFKAIEFIKLSRLEQKKLSEVDHYNEAINRVWGKVAALDTLSGIWTSGFATVLFSGLTFGLGAIIILTGTDTLQVGQIVALLSYCAIFYTNINTVFQTTIDKKKTESEYSKILTYMELTGERERNQNKSEFHFNKNIEFRNCNFSYNGTDIVLDNFSINFENGKWTGIVGASGSGKSTILDIILKLYEVSDGEVFIDGVDINQIDCFSIREHITKIMQDVFLFPGTIEDNLRLVNQNLSEEEIQQALEFACLKDYVAMLPDGIKTDVGEAGKLMSGGERQRLSIAMGILRKNRILLLDEVTSNLDPKVEEQLALNFHQLVLQGYTIISISHKADFLKFADTTYEVK